MDQQFSISISRRTIRLMLALAVVLAALAPVAVMAAGGTFVDDDMSIFEDNIEWMAANGITSGCGSDTYCPEDNVTRGQMAAFMQRLATKKVVDAATAVTADSATTADNANTAGDANTVGGMTPAELTAGQPLGVGFYDTTTLFGSGVTGINSPATGVYCVTIDPSLGVTDTDVVVQVAVEWAFSSGSDLFAFWATPNDCLEDQFEVRTYQFSYDGAGDVNSVELSGSVAWTFSMYTLPEAIVPARVVENAAPTNAGN